MSMIGNPRKTPRQSGEDIPFDDALNNAAWELLDQFKGYIAQEHWGAFVSECKVRLRPVLATYLAERDNAK